MDSKELNNSIWISIKDSNPPRENEGISKRILTWNGDLVQMCYYYYGDNIFSLADGPEGQYIEGITHWRIPPSPPRTYPKVEPLIGFKKGDKVNYKGGKSEMFKYGKFHTKELSPNLATYIWAIMCHEMIRYVIQHPEGFPKEYFINTDGFADGFEAVFSAELKDGLLYTYANEEDLELVESK